MSDKGEEEWEGVRRRGRGGREGSLAACPDCSSTTRHSSGCARPHFLSMRRTLQCPQHQLPLLPPSLSLLLSLCYCSCCLSLSLRVSLSLCLFAGLFKYLLRCAAQAVCTQLPSPPLGCLLCGYFEATSCNFYNRQEEEPEQDSCCGIVASKTMLRCLA